MQTNRQKIEATGASFSIDGMLHAREKTWKAIEEIRRQIKPGLLEREGSQIADQVFKQMGMQDRWHRPWVRFGENTLLSYGKLGNPDIHLKENDIFFMDFGPVFEGYEADAGATYAVGDDAEMQRCARDVKVIYDATRDKWNDQHVTGETLYQFAKEKADSLGWILSLQGANGHRLCDFPHALYHKGPIAKLDFTPSPYLWVLEIQIRHPERPFGAFYEDLLFG